MSSKLAVQIKHSGKAYPVTIDLDAPGSTFKSQIHELTGVAPEKVKVVVKGGMLKDDADMRKLGLKEGQTIMVIGAAGPLPQAPAKPIQFMEDMTDTQLAEAIKYPVGLDNLGNTCYLNSTIQALRVIPELQSSLSSYRSTSTSMMNEGERSVTSSLRDLYGSMSKSSEHFPPFAFLQALRQFAPQFAERARSSNAFAQQDAQEAWSTIVNAIKSQIGNGEFVDKYLMGEYEKTLKLKEDGNEEPTVSKEKFLEVKCNIGATTNYMMSGIQEALDQDIEKTSTSLGREAVYHESSRISRLPSYLTVHMVRFYWRRDIGKKTKIMRKVKFPFDLDVMDLLTDDLKKKIGPVNEKLKEVDRDRRERARVRRRAKIAQEASTSSAPMEVDGKENEEDDPKEVELKESDAPSAEKAAGELVDEPTKRKEETETLRSLVDKDLVNDEGANLTAMYELVAVLTHKGASADGGHYVAWSRVDQTTTVKDIEDPEKLEYFCFDDTAVTTVPRSRIVELEGGGEAHCAYILLYASKKID